MPTRNWTDSRFNKLIPVDPGEIVHYQDIRDWRHPRITPYRPGAGVGARKFVLQNIGKVLDGDWDLLRSDFEQNEIHRLLSERFECGVRWEETEVFLRYAREVAAGERRWHWSSSYEELLDSSRRVDALYEKIRRNGYQPSGRRGRGGVGDEVTVSIGRDGQLLYNNVGGHHRLSIAKLLNIETIPVHVLIRHRQWQDVRDEVRTVSTALELSESTRRYLGHPDLADVAGRITTKERP